MHQDKKLNNTRPRPHSLHLFALMTALRKGPSKIRRINMTTKRLSRAIVWMAIYVGWTMFFIISELNASIFMEAINKIAKRITLGY